MFYLESFSFSSLHLLLHLSLHPDRKLKKLVRAIKDKGSAEEEKEDERPPQQWNLDYALAPFEGLTPEYMEMSESAHTHTHTHTEKLHQEQRAAI